MIIIITIYAILLLALFFMTDLIKDRFSLVSDDSRKIVHVVSCITVCTFPFTLENIGIYLICIIFILITSFTKYIGMFRSMHSVKRITFGVEAYPVGVLIAAYCFLPLEKTAFIYGILIGGFSDTMAEIVGKKYRFAELNIFGQKKSIGGSTSFFITTIIITYSICLFLGIDMKFTSILFIALFLTVAELVQTFGLDNVTIPALAGMAFTYFI